jgi:hypothetical protein
MSSSSGIKAVILTAASNKIRRRTQIRKGSTERIERKASWRGRSGQPWRRVWMSTRVSPSCEPCCRPPTSAPSCCSATSPSPRRSSAPPWQRALSFAFLCLRPGLAPISRDKGTNFCAPGCYPLAPFEMAYLAEYHGWWKNRPTGVYEWADLVWPTRQICIRASTQALMT